MNLYSYNRIALEISAGGAPNTISNVQPQLSVQEPEVELNTHGAIGCGMQSKIASIDIEGRTLVSLVVSPPLSK